MHWSVGAFIVSLAQATSGQRHRRQEAYSVTNSTSAESTVVDYATNTVQTTVTASDAASPQAYGESSSNAVTTSSSSGFSASAYFASTGTSSVPATVIQVSQVTTYLTVSASESASASAFSYAPSPVGPETASENVTFSYEPTTSIVQAPTAPTAPTAYTTTTTATANATCGGATLNVLDASLDWWYTQTYSYAASTLSLLYNENDTQTGWTLIPATTTFNVTSAVAEETCTPSPTYDTYINKTITDYGCFSTPAPVAASTTVLTVNAVGSTNVTTGNGTNYPDIVLTPPPATVTIPSSAGTFAAGTPFVFFSAYEIMSKKPTTYNNGSEGCATATSVYNMSKPFSFEYDGPDVNGTLLVGQDVVGDVNPAFLGVVNRTIDVTAGSWVAAPTVAVVVKRVVVAQAVLAAHTEVSETALDVPTPTLPPGISLLPPTTAQSETLAVPSARIESSGDQLQVPSATTVLTTKKWLLGPQTFIAHLESSDSTLILPSATDVSSFVTNVNGQDVTAFAEGDVPPRTSAAGDQATQTVKPFVAHLQSSDIVLAVPVPETQTVVTAVQNGHTYTATALSAVETQQGYGQGNGNTNGGSGSSGSGNTGGGFGGLLSAIVGAAGAAQPTNALQVLSAALGQEHDSPTASAILAGLGGGAGGAALVGSSSGNNGGSNSGSGSNNGGGSSSGSGNSGNAQADQLPASPAQVLTYNGAAVTPHAASAYVVDGQTAVAGGVPITVSGTVISVPTGGSAIVVGGSTTQLSGSSSVFNVDGMAVTAGAVNAYPIAGQTLQAGGQAITVDGHQLSLAPGGNALVIDGSTSTIAGGAGGSGNPTNIPLLTVGGKTYTANAATQYYFGAGETLTPGGVITVSGTTISLASGASAVVVNGQTQSLTAPNAAAAATTAPAVLTVDNQAFAPNSAGSYLISGQTLTPGGAVTFSGPNGMETISLDSAGSVMVDVVSGHTMTSTLGSAAGTAAPLLTIGSQTFTALPGSGTSYIIDGKTLTPGGVETVTIAGSTYIVSLSPMATVLEIEMEGSSGQITATSFETLFPATMAGGTVYMTATGSGSNGAAQTGTGASAGASSTGVEGASLQGAAAPMMGMVQMTGAAVALGSLVLAILL